MNTENTNQEVLTQEGTPQETTGGPSSYAAGEGVLVAIRDITVPEDARPHPPEGITSLAGSIEREGQLQNALLSKEGDKLVLVYGNGRLLAILKLGRDKMRCDIREGLTEDQKIKLALAENAEREDESPFHTAMMLQKLMKAKGLTQEQLADELKIARSLVTKYMALMGITTEVRQNVNALTLSLRQCLEVTKLTKVEDQLKVIEECATQDLAGKALEKRIKQLLTPAKEGVEPKPQTPAGPFQFLWKGNGLLIKGRLLKPHTETLQQYMNELEAAYNQFMEEEKTRQAA